MLTNPPIMDIEASGFGADSYPIEVGVITESGQRYCSLISPDPGWQHWDLSAEGVHGISRETLFFHGHTLENVCRELNQLLANQTVYSDAWAFDQRWLNKLFYTANIDALFRLSAIEHILTEAQLSVWDTTKQAVIADLDISRHRASSDAYIIQETYKRSLKSQ